MPFRICKRNRTWILTFYGVWLFQGTFEECVDYMIRFKYSNAPYWNEVPC